MLKTIFFIGIGSGIGGILRYLLSEKLTKYNSFFLFPVGIFIINVIGSFLMGFFFSFFEKKIGHNDLQLFITIGLLGGFTTFSSFSKEVLIFFQNQEFLKAITYSFSSLIISILACFLGYFFMNFVK